jgi:hypothetical protein
LLSLVSFLIVEKADPVVHSGEHVIAVEGRSSKAQIAAKRASREHDEVRSTLGFARYLNLFGV